MYIKRNWSKEIGENYLLNGRNSKLVDVELISYALHLLIPRWLQEPIRDVHH